MAGFARFMAVTTRLSTAAADGRDGSTAEIAQFENLTQNDGSSLFEIGESLRQVAPPLFLTYQYVRRMATKKRKSPRLYFLVAHPPGNSAATALNLLRQFRREVRK
jgi:hypothetical protein